MTDDEAREARYGKAIWDTSRADEGTISATGANIVARAVMAVADAEVEAATRELRAEVERLRKRGASLEADLKQANLWSWELHDRAEAAEAERDQLRAAMTALADRLGCRDRHDDAGEMVCSVHGFMWPEEQQWCNGVTALEAEVLALARVGEADTQPEGAGDPNCVGLCGHGKDPSACPSGCTADAAPESGEGR